MKRGIRKILSFVICKIACNIVAKVILKPWLIISKRLKLPYYDRADANFIGPLRMHFKRTKSTLDSLMYLGGNRRCVPLRIAMYCTKVGQ